MRALLWVLALFAAAVGLAIAARYNQGYVLFVAAPYRIELSLNLFVVATIALFVAGHLALRLIAVTLRLPDRVRQYRDRRSRERAIRCFLDAFRHYLEGRYGHALKESSAAFEAGAAPAAASLLAARAAAAMREREREREWLERAAGCEPEWQLAQRMTELELDVEGRRFEDAARVIGLLAGSRQTHAAARRLALRVWAALGRWTELLHTLRALEKHGAIAAEHALALRQRAHLETIRSLGGDTAALARWWDGLPRAERDDAHLVAAYARALLDGADCAGAQRVIESRLAQSWDEALLPMYAECAGGDALARVTRAEQWLQAHERDAGLLLVLGRLCEQLELWGKAQSYLEASLAIRPSREAHVALAGLFDTLGRSEEADRHFRAAATDAGAAPR